MADLWLPRLYVLGQIAALVVCGALLAIGKDSVITDVFLASSGALLGTSAYARMTQGKAPKPSD
jgi:glycopeptide antibiotics resistance protein